MSANLPQLAKLIRANIIHSTTAAGSGHLSSSFSAVELMTALFFGDILKFDLNNPDHSNNDRLIFSKGHAAPLLYALYAAAGKVSRAELLKLRQLDSPLEGHPTMEFPFTEAATGSLGQGLSIGAGMAHAAKLDQLTYKTYVLLGDGEMAEGQIWEAMQLAAHYRLDNLIGIVDVNRLGQVGETMVSWQLDVYEARANAFGWETVLVDGHNLTAILNAYQKLSVPNGKPKMLIAQTVKGKGVSFVENKLGFHGKSLTQAQSKLALLELGEIDEALVGEIGLPDDLRPQLSTEKNLILSDYKIQPENQSMAPRQAYGNSLLTLGQLLPEMVVLDGDVANSTHAQVFKKAFPQRYFEMFIAEQNMISWALGLAQRGKIPFVSTFGAFLTRAFDQIRMAQYSHANLKLIGSHVGVSIGADGASQMGLEDIAMMRSIKDSVVFYPADAHATQALVEVMSQHQGISYLRLTRAKLPTIYDESQQFKIGQSKVLKASGQDVATIVTAGITLHEALKAYDQLSQENIHVRVIDLYSLKPLDEETLQQAARETGRILTVEDHYQFGGIGEAVKSVLVNQSAVVDSLFVDHQPHSGPDTEMLAAFNLDAQAIINKVKQLIKKQNG